jgi:hypothetical protein
MSKEMKTLHARALAGGGWERVGRKVKKRGGAGG